MMPAGLTEGKCFAEVAAVEGEFANMINVTTGTEQADRTEEIQLVLLQVVQALVDAPQSIEVRCEESDGQTCFRIRVCGSDIGKVIGKQGRTAGAIRTILSAASIKSGHRYSIDILQLEQTG